MSKKLGKNITYDDNFEEMPEDIKFYMMIVSERVSILRNEVSFSLRLIEDLMASHNVNEKKRMDMLNSFTVGACGALLSVLTSPNNKKHIKDQMDAVEHSWRHYTRLMEEKENESDDRPRYIG